MTRQELHSPLGVCIILVTLALTVHGANVLVASVQFDPVLRTAEYERGFEQEARNQANGTPVVFVYDRDYGKTIDARTGDLIVLSLVCDDLFSGYLWAAPDDFAPSLAVLTPRAQPQVCPTSWRGVIKLEAKTPGTNTLRLYQRHPRRKDPLSRNFTVTINVAP